MSESVHAVVANSSSSSNAQNLHQHPQQHQFRQHHALQSANTTANHRTNHQGEVVAEQETEEEEEEVDEDDDIDIIGKFGSASSGNPLPNPLSFMTAASTSIGSNSYLLQTTAAAPNFSNISFHPNPNSINYHQPQFHHPQQQYPPNSGLNANYRLQQENSAPTSTSHLTPTNASNQFLLENSGNSSDSFNVGLHNRQTPVAANAGDFTQDAKSARRGGGDDDDSSSQQHSHHQRQHRQQSRASNRPGDGGGQSNTSGSEWATEGHFAPARDRLRRALRYYFMSPIDKW